MCWENKERDINLNECVALAVVNFQDGRHVPTAITVIGCTKYGNHLLFLSKICRTWFKKEKKKTTNPKRENATSALKQEVFT